MIQQHPQHQSNNRLLRLPKVIQRTGLSRSSIYEGMKNGTFPKSLKLSQRAVGWRESDIQAWIDERGEDAA